ncbi:hypothetical protein CC78DRAFT_536615 [Lojkania enalia]|uniref:Uncharacterized protein n=1 Tax=Lojkania enalia TaxID=147567 RepID=A0A9P4N2U3_9PLEO|nr:hypothetical protein CC78DRAFT_536615 [Didymosphaeria enalia]
MPALPLLSPLDTAPSSSPSSYAHAKQHHANFNSFPHPRFSNHARCMVGAWISVLIIVAILGCAIRLRNLNRNTTARSEKKGKADEKFLIKGWEKEGMAPFEQEVVERPEKEDWMGGMLT